jgi:hypothetical protein
MAMTALDYEEIRQLLARYDWATDFGDADADTVNQAQQCGERGGIDEFIDACRMAGTPKSEYYSGISCNTTAASNRVDGCVMRSIPCCPRSWYEHGNLTDLTLRMCCCPVCSRC